MSTQPALVLDSIEKSFGRRRVVRAATVHVHAGRITALLGRNGCGKTTLLRIAAGEIARDGGCIDFLGRTVARPRLHQLAPAGLFYLPERGLLTGSATAGERFSTLTRRYALAATDSVIAALRLDDLLDRTAAEMSTGERRRAELGLVLTRRPLCLLADEPFFGIAPADAEQIAASLRAIADAGCAVLVTGHEVRTLLDISDDVVWMTAGTTHALGTPAEAVKNGSFMRDYLGTA